MDADVEYKLVDPAIVNRKAFGCVDADAKNGDERGVVTGAGAGPANGDGAGTTTTGAGAGIVTGDGAGTVTGGGLGTANGVGADAVAGGKGRPNVTVPLDP